MKFTINGRSYDAAALDEVSLRDILLLEQQTTDFGRRLTWTEVTDMAARLEALKTDEERLDDEASLWLTAVTIWASRRLAGDPVTFDQAVDFPLKDLVFIKEAHDERPKVNPQKARPGSGRAANGARTGSRKT